MSNRATATVTFYNCADRFEITGRIKQEYKAGLTIEDERGVIYYAPTANVQKHETPKEWLW